MKSFDELKEFYRNVLEPELRVIEKSRKKVLRRVINYASIIVGIAAAVIIFVLVLFGPKDFIAFLFILTLGGLFIMYKLTIKNYVGDFKTNIIYRLVHFIDESLVYKKDSHVSKSTFILSRIFRQHPDRLRGDDYVSGTLGKTALEFSELHAEYETTDSKGRSQWHTIFKGLFFVADFNKHFKGRTVVLPDTAERLFGHIGTLLQSWGAGRNQLIKLEDPEFEKLFVVYGDNQVEARYILSTSLMKRIVDFKKKTKQNLFISFVGSKIFVAVSFTKDLFEPSVFKTVLDFGQILEYYEDLQLALGIVDDLNLNTRIWSKQ